MCSIAIDRLYSMILVKGVYFLSPQLKLFFVQVLLPVAVPGVFFINCEMFKGNLSGGSTSLCYILVMFLLKTI